MSRVVKLTEADLSRIVKRVIKEQSEIEEGRGAAGHSNQLSVTNNDLSTWLNKTFGQNSFGTFASNQNKFNFSDGKKTVLYPKPLETGKPLPKGSWKNDTTKNVVLFSIQ